MKALSRLILIFILLAVIGCSRSVETFNYQIAELKKYQINSPNPSRVIIGS